MQRILIIDDDHLIVRFLARWLSNVAGVTVQSAFCASEAWAGVDKGRRGEIDLVLLDLHIAELSAADIYRAFRELGIPVLVMTGGVVNDEERSLVETLPEILWKPFTYVELQLALRRTVVERIAS